MPKAVRAALLLTAVVCVAAHAQTAYPTKPIRIVAPSAAGSAADTLARTIAPALGERLGQSVIVDTRPGAATILGTEIVARAAADGHTLLIALPALTINPSIYRTLPYDPQKDFSPITQALNQANLIVSHPSLPARNVQELIALAKSRPGELVYGSSGLGAASHLTIELFMLMTGTRMLHVPYKGPAPALVDLIAGRLTLAASSTIATLPHVRSGRLRAIGVTTAQRLESEPDILTIAEGGVPGFESVAWFGPVAPAGTPSDVIARLHKEIVAIITAPDVKARFARDGGFVVGGTPEDFDRFMRAETVKWAKVVKAAGIKPE
jgi:tripartite-type tricarboxylate transporter receptor subunit TctC